MLLLSKVLLLSVVLATIEQMFAYDDCFVTTGIDSRWKRRCKRRQFVSTVDSAFKKHYGDRVWRVCCRNLPVPEEDLASNVKCANWTGYVNNYGGVVDFACPNSGFIAGIRSQHSNEREDRVFRFKCCSVPGYSMSTCRSSGIINRFNKKAAYTVGQGRVLTGMGAVFRDHYKDRLFEFQDCLMQKMG